jgi:hypothetical protein
LLGRGGRKWPDSVRMHPREVVARENSLGTAWPALECNVASTEGFSSLAGKQLTKLQKCTTVPVLIVWVESIIER